MEDFREKFYEKYYSTFKKYLFTNDFEKVVEKTKRWYTYKYLPIIGQYPKESKILDIGCGMGVMLDFLKTNNYNNIQGVEISEEQYNFAKNKGHNVTLKNAFEFLRIGNKFDIIIAMDFVEHFNKNELLELFQLFFDSLKTGGCLILHTPNGEGLVSNRAIYGDLTHLTIFTPNSMTQILKISGFDRIEYFETGPAAKNLVGLIRLLFWKIIKLGANFIRLVEKNQRHKILTQEFITAAYKNKT